VRPDSTGDSRHRGLIIISGGGPASIGNHFGVRPQPGKPKIDKAPATVHEGETARCACSSRCRERRRLRVPALSLQRLRRMALRERLPRSSSTRSRLPGASRVPKSATAAKAGDVRARSALSNPSACASERDEPKGGERRCPQLRHRDPERSNWAHEDDGAAEAVGHHKGRAARRDRRAACLFGSGGALRPGLPAPRGATAACGGLGRTSRDVGGAPIGSDSLRVVPRCRARQDPGRRRAPAPAPEQR
jgi:hypothetical protein